MRDIYLDYNERHFINILGIYFQDRLSLFFCVDFLNSLKFYRSSNPFSFKINLLSFRVIYVDVAMLIQKQTLFSIVHLLAVQRPSFVPKQKTNLPLNFLCIFQTNNFKTDGECR